jgi:transposase-like protein
MQQAGGLTVDLVADHLGHAETVTTRRFYTYSLGGELRSAPAVERLAADVNLPGLVSAIGPAPLPPPALQRPNGPAAPEAEAEAAPPRPSAYELRKEAARRRALGETYAAIAERLGVAAPTVRRWIVHESGDARDTDSVPSWAERRERALALYREGLPGEEVAARVGASYSSVYRWLDEAGLPRRGPRRGVESPRAYSAEVRERALELHAAGVSAKAIGARLGVSDSSVSGWLHEAGVPKRWKRPPGAPRVVSAEVREQALELYATGVPVKEIGARLGITRTAVYHWLDAAGVPRRGPRPRAENPYAHPEAVRERIFALNAAGVPVKEIGARLGISRTAVYRWIDAAGVPRRRERPPAVPAAVRARALELYAAGVPLGEIAAACGVCRAAVCRWRRVEGLPARGRWPDRHNSGTTPP